MHVDFVVETFLLLITVSLVGFIIFNIENEYRVRTNDQQSKLPYQRWKPQLQVLWNGQETALRKSIAQFSKLRQEALTLSRIEGKFQLPGSLIDFCPRCPALPLLFLKSGTSVVVISPNRQQLRQLLDFTKAIDPASMSRVQLLWNIFASTSAKDDAFNQHIKASPPAVHLNNLTTVFPKASVITLRLCLQQLDGFLFDSSTDFFARFKVPVIVTQDYSDVKTDSQRIIAVELRRRTYFSVQKDLKKWGFLPFDASGKVIVQHTLTKWPSVVHWKRTS